MIRFVYRGWERMLDESPVVLRPKRRSLPRRLYRKVLAQEDQLRRLWIWRS
jgi:hypothetical protein